MLSFLDNFKLQARKILLAHPYLCPSANPFSVLVRAPWRAMAADDVELNYFKETVFATELREHLG